MKIFQKSLIFCLVALLVLSMAACGAKKGDTNTGTSAPSSDPSIEELTQIVETAPGKITIYADLNVTIGYDANGNALAAIGEIDATNSLLVACKIANQPCAEAIASVVAALAEEYAQGRNFITIRQEMGSPNPGDDFMTKIYNAATAATEVPIVVVSIADMDETGYFNQNTAKSVMRAAFGDHVEIVSLSEMREGKYVVTIQQSGENLIYLMSALTGSLRVHSDTVDEPIIEGANPGPLDVLFDPNQNSNQQEEPTEEQTQEESPAA